MATSELQFSVPKQHASSSVADCSYLVNDEPANELANDDLVNNEQDLANEERRKIEERARGLSSVSDATAEIVQSDMEKKEYVSAVQTLLMAVLYSVPMLIVFILLSSLSFGGPVYVFFVEVDKYKYIFYAIGAGLIFSLYIFDYALIFRYNRSNRVLTVLVGVISLYIFLAGAVTRTKYSPHSALLVVVFQLPLYCAIARYVICDNVRPKPFFRRTCSICLTIGAASLLIWLLVTGPPATATQAWSDKLFASHGENLVASHNDIVLCLGSRNIELACSCDRNWVAGACPCPEDLSDAKDCIRECVISKCDAETGEERIRSLNFEEHCRRISRFALTLTQQQDFKLACKYANTLTFVLWGGPFIGASSFFTFTVFVFVRQLFITKEISYDRVRSLEGTLKAFTMFAIMLIMSIYIAAEVAGASMMVGSIVLNFTSAGFMCLCVWASVHFRIRELKRLASKSFFISSVLSMPESPWAQAAFLCAFNFAILAFLAMDWITQRVRTCQPARFAWYEEKGYVRLDLDAQFTSTGTRIIQRISSWHWADVGRKVIFIGSLFVVFFVVFTKVTYVFLAFLNVALEPFDFSWVVCIYAITGLLMFLLPPVPGIPVYILGGILFGYAGACPCKGGKAKLECNEVSVSNPGDFEYDYDGCIGFWPAIGVAVAVATGLKLTAVSVQQKLIGEGLGRFRYIQNLVGVHKTPIRAIEKLLREGDGLTFAKVCILCGGPDWPTSVLTGILHLKLSQMLLGTLPCVLLTTPCIFSGALLLRQAQVGLWAPLSGLSLTIAGLLQMFSMMAALFAIQNCISKHGDELQAPRPEHEAICALEKEQQLQDAMYREQTKWEKLNCLQRGLLLISAFLMMMFMGGTLFLNAPGISFKEFGLSSRINDPVSDGGLGGDPLAIVEFWGWVELAAYAGSIILFLCFSMTVRTKSSDSPVLD